MTQLAAFLLAVAAIAGCHAVHHDAHFGSNSGPKSAPEIDAMIEALRALPRVYPSTDASAPGPAPGTQDFLHLYFGSAYNGELVDAVFFVDVDGGSSGPTIYSALTRGEERPSMLREEQNVWALIMVAAPESYCFSSDLLHEVIAPVAQPAETGIVAALLSLTKLGSKPEPPLASRDNRTYLTLPKKKCKPAPANAPDAGAKSSAGTDHAGTDHGGADKPGADKPGADKPGADKAGADKGSAKDNAPEAMPFWRVGSSTDRELYAALVKLSLSAGTTNRLVLSSRYHPEGAEPQIEPATTSAVTTFRNASRPYFRTSVGLGLRLELEGVHTTGEVTERGRLYDPDLFVMFHALPGFAGFLKGLPGGLGRAFGRLEDFQLHGEWYPSLFIGTNLVSRNVFTDLIFGVRLPLLLNSKVGIAIGDNWSRFTFNTDEMCTKDCITRARRHHGLFLGIDYDF